MICVHSRDNYNVFPTQIKLCGDTKGNRLLKSRVQLRPSDSLGRSSYQEIPPSTLDRPVFPLQWGNLKMPKRSSLLRPRSMFEHVSLTKHLVSEEHLLRILRTYNNVAEGFRRQSQDMVRVSVCQEVQFRCDRVVRRQAGELVHPDRVGQNKPTVGRPRGHNESEGPLTTFADRLIET